MKNKLLIHIKKTCTFFLCLSFSFYSLPVTTKPVTAKTPKKHARKNKKKYRKSRKKYRKKIKKSRKSRKNKKSKKIHQNFSQTMSKYFEKHEYEDDKNYLIWSSSTPKPFDELILSWNARRPKYGKITFFVSVKHKKWSKWHKLAQWRPDSQQTFVNKLDPHVHTKHVRVEMQKKRLGKRFRIKVVFSHKSLKPSIHALFVCLSRKKHFHIIKPKTKKRSILIKNVPRQSQMLVKHPRHRDLCSPTSMSMIIRYFDKQKNNTYDQSLADFTADFADTVHDDSPLDIYGNWILNIAQAYDSSQANVFYRVQRLNNFNELYSYIAKKIPVAVSVRYLKGGAIPYTRGHFLVIVGWNQKKKAIICIDPRFRKKTLRAYHINNFLRAWGVSRNLSYIALPKKQL